MARLWWTLDPSKYYLKQISSGGRNEILFTLIGKILNEDRTIAYLASNTDKLIFLKILCDSYCFFNSQTGVTAGFIYYG